jgi:hypothetical protein
LTLTAAGCGGGSDIGPLTSGSSTDASSPQSSAAIALTPPITFTPPKIVSNDNANEPGIKENSLGIFIDAIGSLITTNRPGGPSFVYRSTDNGATFKSVGPPLISPSNVTIGGADCDLATDARSNLYLIDLWIADASAAFSSNGGASWSGIPLGDLPLEDRPWISADPRSDHVGLAYAVTHVLPVGLFLSSTSSGTVYTTSALEALDLVDRNSFASPGNLVTNLKGDTYNVYPIGKGTNGAGIGIGKLPAGSSTVVTGSVKAADKTHPTVGNSFDVIAVDNAPDDNLYVVWVDPVNATTWNIRFSSSTDGGNTWSVPATLGHGLFPWIAAGAPGKVDVIWYTAEFSSHYAGDPNAAPATAIWDVAMAQSLDATALLPHFNASTIAASAAKKGAICTSGAQCTADRELGDFMEVTVDDRGLALIAYTTVPAPSVMRVAFVIQTSGPVVQ